MSFDAIRGINGFKRSKMHGRFKNIFGGGGGGST
jgi:hypothetical protein